jgi:hypothetical protein
MVASESIADSTRLAQAHIRMCTCPLAQCQLVPGFPKLGPKPSVDHRPLGAGGVVGVLGVICAPYE